MPLPKEEYFTYADYLTWEEQEHTELIEGVPMMMAPPSRMHQQISGEIFRQLANYLEGKQCRVYAAPFSVRLFAQSDTPDNQVSTIVEPDISVICDRDKLDDRGCVGAPDLVVEVISPSSIRHDRLTKFNLYRRAGLPEYWIVSPDEQTVQVCVLQDGSYQTVDLGVPGDVVKVNVLDGCFIELARVFRQD